MPLSTRGAPETILIAACEQELDVSTLKYTVIIKSYVTVLPMNAVLSNNMLLFIV